MRKALAAVFVLIAIAALLGSQAETQKPDAASKPAVAEKREPLIKIDKSAEMQEGRLRLLEKLKAQGVFQKVEMPGNLPRLWIAPRFHTIDFDQKEKFVSVVYAYYFDGYNMGDVVRIFDGETAKEIGDYSSQGLKLR
jgi:hypothetical protein